MTLAVYPVFANECVQILTKAGNNSASLPKRGSWLLCVYDLQHVSDVLVSPDLCKTILHAIVSFMSKATSRK